MFGFLFGIVTHTERYGGGETRIVDPQRYVSNVVSLVRGQSLVFIIGAAGLLALITNLKQRSWENSKYKALLAVSAAQVLQVLMVARHPGSDRYLLPALSLAGLTLVLVIEAFSQKVSVALGRYRYAPATIACLIILFVQVQGMKRLYQDWEMETVLLSDVHEKLENDYKNALVVTYHGASSPYFALKAGEYYSGDYYGAILYELYPNQLFYDPWEGKFSNFQEAVEINALKTSDNWFLMHGWTFEAFEEPAALFQALPDKIALEKTYRKGEYRNWEPQRSDRSLYIGREVIYKATIRY